MTIESIEVTWSDIAMANRLMAEILCRSLDERSPQTRRCLLLPEEYVRANCQRLVVERAHYRFSRREFREWIGWSDFQVRMHLDKLVAMEYVLVHHGKQGRCYVYEMICAGQGQDGRPLCFTYCVRLLRQPAWSKNPLKDGCLKLTPVLVCEAACEPLYEAACAGDLRKELGCCTASLAYCNANGSWPGYLWRAWNGCRS